MLGESEVAEEEEEGAKSLAGGMLYSFLPELRRTS